MKPLLAAGGLGLAAYLLSKVDSKPTAKLTSGANRLPYVHPQLQQLVQAWLYEGPHDIYIPSDGGLRAGIEAATAQVLLYREGRSKAATLADTPHGRGAALDVWPTGYDFKVSVDSQPLMLSRLQSFGAFAKRFGFVWGGDWTNLKDYPHVELPDWRKLPYPYVPNS